MFFTKYQNVHESIPELYNSARGELFMENINTAYMGTVFKTARLSAHLTQEEVAEKIGVSTRYIMALENENKHPSLDILLKLVHTLNIPADAILYPDQEIVDNEEEQFFRMFCMLSIRDKKIIHATMQEMIDNK